jgi:TPP-dependent pyruvate/acetoin dehydrogenase alpha subunit
VAVGAAQALAPKDAIVCTHRPYAHAIAHGVPMTVLMGSMFGRREPAHFSGDGQLFDATKCFVGGDLAGRFALVLGMAMSDAMRRREHITACFFSDAAAADSGFLQTINLASTWKLPVLFVYEKCTEPIEYPIPADSVDGMDVLAVELAVHKAAEAIRRGSGPQFLDCRAYHGGDPIALMRDRLKASGEATAALLEAMEDSVREEVTEAVEYASGGYSDNLFTRR